MNAYAFIIPYQNKKYKKNSDPFVHKNTVREPPCSDFLTVLFLIWFRGITKRYGP